MFGTFDFKLCAGENLLSVFATDNNPMNTQHKKKYQCCISTRYNTPLQNEMPVQHLGNASSVQDTSLLQAVIETVGEKVKYQ